MEYDPQSHLRIVKQFIIQLMGVSICNSYMEPSDIGQFEPIMSTFNPITSNIKMAPAHQALFERIKKRLDVVDCRRADLRWFESPKYNLYLFGNVARDRPLGDCLFYIKDPSIQGTPIIIATHVNEHYIYSSNTLILYPDNVLYHGSIRNNISSLPRAEGNGLLLSPEFQYQGEFKNGYPHGYGSYRSRHMEYVGVFKNGEPFGEGIEKTPSQLFIGSIGQNGQRQGYIIDKQNRKTQIENSQAALMESKLSLRSHLRQ